MSSNTKGGEGENEHTHVFCFRRYNHKPLIYLAHARFTSLDSWLKFVPTGPVGVKAWCNDLVLCTSPGPEEPNLYICNPRTRKYVKLPAPSYRKRPCLAGFSWDPYYTFNKETGQVTVNVDCRYNVLYAVPGAYRSTRLKVEIFSSETRVWKKAVLLTPKSFDYPCAMRFNCFTYKGMLHFYSLGEIVGFDPYKVNNRDGVIHGHIIQMPPYDVTTNHIRNVSVGVFGGKLLLIEYCARYSPESDIAQVSIEQDNAYAITVWELENYHTGEWIMKHMIYLHDLVSEDSVLTELIKRGCPNSSLLYFYPNCADIVLLMFPKKIVECNLKGKTLKKVGTIPKVQKVYGLALSWWPSPLPLDI